MLRLPESQGLYLEAEKAMAPHSSTLAWKIPWMKEPGGLQSMGSRSVGHDFTFTFHFHALEKEMATHSSTLAWKIPWMKEPGGLQSTGSQKSDTTEPLHFTFIIGDWNAKGGSQETPGVTGKFGLGVQNEAGQRLIEFCQENTLVIANTLFRQHKRRLYAWTSPDGQRQNQIDYTLCSQR